MPSGTGATKSGCKVTTFSRIHQTFIFFYSINQSTFSQIPSLVHFPNMFRDLAKRDFSSLFSEKLLLSQSIFRTSYILPTYNSCKGDHKVPFPWPQSAVSATWKLRIDDTKTPYSQRENYVLTTWIGRICNPESSKNSLFQLKTCRIM